jgi:ubiquinone/menaquinone biosynthesis C-methylase UbiE
MWEEIGKVQIDFMLRQGLKPDDIFVDVACGSLRAGRHFISYLNPTNYLGLDHNEWLIEAGLKHEITAQERKEKRPEFVVSETFEFDQFTKQPNLGLAQSLFSHLTTDDIHLCLDNLKSKMQPGGRFFATFVPAGFLPPDYENPDESDDKLAFEYDAEDILKIGRKLGWQAQYIGDWGHPRGQEMLEFTVPTAEA